MQSNMIELQKEGKVATIVLNRPEVLNALNSQALLQLQQAVSAVDADSEVIVAIIIGAGEKAFCAGADIGELKGQTLVDHERFIRLGNRVFGMIEDSSKVFVAAVRGYALGGGCELAAACDLRIASEDAKFGQPEVKVGGFPGWGGTQRLPHLVGRTKAVEMILTGAMIDAREAWRIGLVNRVVPTEDLLKEAHALAEEIACNRPDAIRLAKAAINRGFKLEIEYESALNNLNFAGKDRKQGLTDFLEKRGRRG